MLCNGWRNAYKSSRKIIIVLKVIFMGGLTMNIDIDAFLKTLPIDLYGMAGIFIVMAFIYICIKLMNKAFEK